MEKKVVYVWDPGKNAGNIKKHRLSFETAVHAFSDPCSQIEPDHITDDGECRWRITGLVGGTWLLVVVHTVHEKKDGTEIIRIISARRAGPKEERRYEQNCPP